MALCSELFQEGSVVVYTFSSWCLCIPRQYYLRLLQNCSCCSSQPLQPWRSPLLQYGPVCAGILHFQAETCYGLVAQEAFHVKFPLP